MKTPKGKAKGAGIGSGLKIDAVHAEKEVGKVGRGRPVTGKSKSAGVKDGTHFKTSMILPIELYQKLSVEAAGAIDKDMSDIVADMLKERYK